MTMKATGPATGWQEIDRWDHGVGWIAYPDETMQRASQAIESGGEVWLVDPVDASGIDDFISDLGEVVVVLLDRHSRDADQFARRHDVSVHVPRWMSGVEKKVDAPVEELRTELGDTGDGDHQVRDLPFWQEAALYGEDTGTLVVPESFGTVDDGTPLPPPPRRNSVGSHPNGSWWVTGTGSTRTSLPHWTTHSPGHGRVRPHCTRRPLATFSPCSDAVMSTGNEVRP